ncbi:lamin tail domain-containing protein [Patescibacteria group bacterium]|nr:lamin tail domain-containing protein [Patescibacteria group bacterium]
MEGRTKLIILSVLFSSALTLFLFAKTSQAATNYLVINQVQTTGGEGKTTNDFVELFNPTNQDIDLQGYRLIKRTANGTTDTTIKSWTESSIVKAQGFYLWASSSFTDITIVPDITTSQTIADNNGIALRQGANDTGQIIDSLAWGIINNGLAETTAFATNPTTNQSILRKQDSLGNRQDTNDNASDFILANAQPHNSLSPIETPAPPTPINPPPVIIYQPTPTPTVLPGEVVINELVSDPTEGSDEWVEIYNRTNRTIDLSLFSLSDGGNSKTYLSGSLGTNDSSRFYVIRSPKGNLNNSGDTLLLRYQETIIDQISYGAWDDGNITNNAPAIIKPYSLGRLPDGLDSDNDKSDFIKMEPSYGLPNKPLLIELGNNETTLEPSKNTVQFNELYPNPPLDDLTEFIELFNPTDQSINLDNWLLEDNIFSYTINQQSLVSTIIKSQDFLLLPRTTTGLILDNIGTEKITLTSPDKLIKISVSYQGPAKEGASYARQNDGSWIWTTKPTPGQTNIINKINLPPILAWDIPKTGLISEILVFDASDSCDPEKDNLNFKWDFGDGLTSSLTTPSHAYIESKKYTVKLTITDESGLKSEQIQTINITTNPVPKVAGLTSGPILLTEIMPNPKGNDSEEWLELYNPNSTTASAAGWQIINNSQIINLPDLSIEPNNYLVIDKTILKSNLLNKGGKLVLKNNQETTSSLNYGPAKEGLAYALINNKWLWTNFPTPGEDNLLITENEEETIETISLTDVKNIETNTKVKLQGLVAAAPGQISKNIMFLQGSGLQVTWSDNVIIPNIKTGDTIELQGKISRSETYGTRLLIYKNDPLKIIANQPAPQAKEINLNDLNEDLEGEFVTLTGTINKYSASQLTLEQNEDTLVVLLKNKNLKWPVFTLGSPIKITGFVVQTKTGLKLWARSPEDIFITPPELNPLADQPEINLSKQTNNWLSYSLLTVIIIGLLINLFWQKYKLPKISKLIKHLFQNK